MLAFGKILVNSVLVTVLVISYGSAVSVRMRAFLRIRGRTKQWCRDPETEALIQKVLTERS